MITFESNRTRTQLHSFFGVIALGLVRLKVIVLVLNYIHFLE